MRNVPDYVAEILRSDPPPHCGVIPETLPVVSFGDPQRATVATLGINPSSAEFIEKGRFLEHDRRLPTLRSLGVATPAELDDHQVATAVDEFGRYFEIRPYQKWFGPLDTMLSDSLGVSYMDGTACHLDIVPWATEPKWSSLNPSQRIRLLDASRKLLHLQVRQSNVSLVVVNGRQVWDVLTERRLVGVTHEETLALPGVNKSTTVLIGVGLRGLTFAGWTINIQANHGVSKDDKAALATWLSGLRATIPPRLSGDHLEPVTLASKAELAKLLRHWFRTTTGDTVGDRGSFGRTKLIDVALGGGRTAGLNADTTRAAVAKYLDDVEQRGPDAAWRVIANKNGAFNKVEFTTAGPATPGWYCYLTPEAEGDGLV